MKLSLKEQQVLDILINAKGEPLKVVDICDIYKRQHGTPMMHNYCSKIINEQLTNIQGLPIERDYVVIDGKTQSYKEYFIESTTPPKKGTDWKHHFNDQCPLCGSYYRYGNICNQCGFKFKEVA